MGPGHNNPPRDPVELPIGEAVRLPLRTKAFHFVASSPVVLRVWAGHIPDRLQPIVAPMKTDAYAFSSHEPWTYYRWDVVDGDDAEPRMLVNWSD